MFEGKRRKPIFAVLPMQERFKLAQNEVRLWRAVLDQLFADVFMRHEPTEGEELEAHLEALEWFDTEHEDFDNVCELAALDSVVIRRIYNHYRKKYRNGKPPTS